MKKVEFAAKIKGFDFNLEVKTQSEEVIVKDLSDQKLREIHIPLSRIVEYGVKQLLSDSVAGKKPATKAEVWDLFEKRALRQKSEKVDLGKLKELAKEGDIEEIKRLLGLE